MHGFLSLSEKGTSCGRGSLIKVKQPEETDETSELGIFLCTCITSKQLTTSAVVGHIYYDKR